MMRFPFGPRPMPRRPYPGGYQQNRPQPKISYEQLMEKASFTPELSFLLAMTLKDGMNQNAVLEMLRKIAPFVGAEDQRAIHSLLGARQFTDRFKSEAPSFEPQRGESGLSGYAKHSRQQSLLNVLRGYASDETAGMMKGMQQSYEMQSNFQRMTRRMEKLRNMNSASPEDMFEALSMFMPPEQMGQFKNMQNMMRMMSNMGNMDNFKPEDILGFMNANQNQ